MSKPLQRVKKSVKSKSNKTKKIVPKVPISTKEDEPLKLDPTKESRRTQLQNKAMHKWFDQIAITLNEAGLDQKVVFSKYKMDVPWGRYAVKEELWRRAQKSMLHKESTTELNTAEVTKVYDVVNRFLSENFGVHIPFPSIGTLFDEKK